MGVAVRRKVIHVWMITEHGRLAKRLGYTEIVFKRSWESRRDAW